MPSRIFLLVHHGVLVAPLLVLYSEPRTLEERHRTRAAAAASSMGGSSVHGVDAELVGGERCFLSLLFVVHLLGKHLTLHLSKLGILLLESVIAVHILGEVENLLDLL